MRSSNPALSDKVFEKAHTTSAATEAGWAAPTPQQLEEQYNAPAYERPVAGGVDGMTVSGTIWATAALLVLLIGAGVFGWNSVDATLDTVSFPGWLFPVMLGGLGVAILTIFKPELARFTGPVYALLQGAFVGAISAVYNTAYDGIVLQAVGLTIGVFAVMLFLFATRIIKVTDKLRMGIVAATGAIFLVYMVNIVLSFFDASVPFLHDTGPLGIGISLVIVGVAAFNLLLDFDFVERGVAAQLDRKMEWYAAFGLLVTIVWLYLELLRLLAKLQGRD
ncbi:MAG: Bax inhibitor-1/YccA family protein [Acidimicrobiales bacterium]